LGDLEWSLAGRGLEGLEGSGGVGGLERGFEVVLGVEVEVGFGIRVWGRFSLRGLPLGFGGDGEGGWTVRQKRGDRAECPKQ